MSNMTLEELLQSAVDAENRGVPVNWRTMTFNMHQSFMNHLESIQGQGNAVDPVEDLAEPTED
tara:strand:+ start:3947 stop:4135 length:189 start_codon:yes stop_codon:yes gene_type:complete